MLVLSLAVWLAIFNPVNISLVYAQEATPTNTPAATDLSSPSPTDSPTPTASPDQSLTTGNSSSTANSETTTNISDVTTTPSPSDSPTDSPTDTPTDLPTPTVSPDPSATDSATPTDTPTGTPTDSPTPTPDPSSVSTDQTGTTSTDTSATTDSGNNSQTGTGSASMTTGNTQSTSNSITVTNLSTVDANLVTTVQNILTSNTGDVNLYQLLENAIAVNPNAIPGGTITINQNASVDTNTNSSANTGGNTQNSGTTTMSTGGAVALANAITATNISEVGSNTLLAIINILADWGGNIILPDGSELSLSQTSGSPNVNASQNGQVVSTTSASTNTGSNSQTGGSSNLTTGNSNSTANSANLVNIIEIGNGLGYLIINNMGGWTGSLINWTTPGSSQSFSPGTYNLLASYSGAGGGSGGNTNVTVNQNANVSSNVTASATTGGNSQTGKDNSMTTGGANSIANNFTLTNLTSVGGGFFFGIINIFGHWTGNIFSGPIPTPSSSSDPVPADPPADPTPDTRTPDLSVSVWDNVAAYVKPGDTVLAAVTVTNNSPFIAHDVTVSENITNDNSSSSTPMNWNLGDVKPGGKVKISFNAGVPKDSETSMYQIAATATGLAESGDSSSASGASNFLVEGFASFYLNACPTSFLSHRLTQ